MRNSKGLWICVVVACILCSLIINVPGYTKYVPYVSGGRSYTLYDGAYEEKSNDGTKTGKFYAAGGKIDINNGRTGKITPYSLSLFEGTYVNYGALIAQCVALYFIVVGTVKIIQISRNEKQKE